MQGGAPWSRGFQARPLCSPQGDTFQNARIAYDAGDSRPAHDIDGVPAVTHAIDDDNGVCQHCVTPLKLRASGFVDPDLADGPATGALLSLIIARERQATLPYRIGTIGQLFSINGSRTKAAMR